MLDRADCLARREFLAGVAALGASGLASRHPAEAQMATAKPHRIDVHHHHTPPPYLVAITAITAPALRFLDDAGARKLARECNDYSAKLVADSRGRFGMFAVMPMPY